MPVTKFRCPHCARSTNAGEYRWVDASGTEVDADGYPVSTDQRQSQKGKFGKLLSVYDKRPRIHDEEVANRLRRLAADIRLKCPHCQGECSRQMVERESLFVAMIGEPSSSKTSFLAASVRKWQYADHIAAEGITYNPAGSSDQLKSAIDRMFKDREPPGTTQPLAEGVRRDPFLVVARTNTREVNLIFIDVAGEDMEDSQRMASTAEFLAISDFYFVFVTPSIAVGDTSRRIAQAILTDEAAGRSLLHDDDNSVQSIDRTLSIVNGVLELRGSRVQSIGGPNVNVSVIVPKADLLVGLHTSPAYSELVAGIIPPKDWLEASEGESDKIAGASILEASERTRELVQHMNSNLAAVLQQNFKNARYFAVSAAGCAARPEEDGVMRFPGVVPYRCTDPFLDMLRTLPQLRVGGRIP